MYLRAARRAAAGGVSPAKSRVFAGRSYRLKRSGCVVLSDTWHQAEEGQAHNLKVKMPEPFTLEMLRKDLPRKSLRPFRA
jgi:hypothetical protein